MSKIDDGGPAFPRPLVQAENSYEFSHSELVPQSGMTLRDYFAAKAMQAMVAGHLKHNRDPRNKGGEYPLFDFTAPDCENICEDDEANVEIMVQTAYIIANAMIAARKVQP